MDNDAAHTRWDITETCQRGALRVLCLVGVRTVVRLENKLVVVPGVVKGAEGPYELVNLFLCAFVVVAQHSASRTQV